VSTTDWHDAEVAERFEGLDGLTERTVGFPVLFRELGLEGHDVTNVLDYGCGPGKTACEIADLYDVGVTAVDSSAEMLRLAERHPHDRVRYRLLEHGGLSFVEDGSIDAAMSCFVFINVLEVAELRRIATAVCRVLRPGGRYVLMDSNPDATGVRFASFVTGEPGRAYGAGEARRVELYGANDTVLELTDYHWPESTYREVLADAGFGRTTTIRPKATPAQAARIEALTGEATSAESRHAPMIVVVGEK
jgi:ubiquinone/menaquinone biosynthesis C-methylase UbiE